MEDVLFKATLYVGLIGIEGVFFVLGEGDVCSCREYFMEWKIWRLRSWLVSLRSLNISCWNIVLKFIHNTMGLI